MVRLIFLGKFRPLAPPALDSVTPPESVTTLRELQDWVAIREPGLGAAMAETPIKIIMNNEIVHDTAVRFGADDEIAFLPPMSGG